MPAPDLPPPPNFRVDERPLHVHLHAKLTDPAAFAGAVVIVIDALRASVTITAALANGAAHVVPVLTVEEAIATKARMAGSGTQGGTGRPPPGPLPPGGGVVLGGERGGILIPGFDLDNSPRNYTRERVAGRTVIFTTSNGTAALLHARAAAEILVGSFANLSAVCDAVAHDPRPVHILCCGTRDELSLDDILPAGALVDRLTLAGRKLVADDSARVALMAWRGANASPGGLAAAMHQSRGGRNLAHQNLGADVDFCSKLDTVTVVPRFDPAAGHIILKLRPA
ncbi:MAG: putative 2-phosphosulfolactate phosphatase [Phycisphaerae bacterium]|nr:MAG: putative 2-phosphosulfolactate phosphatase [Phycisphaerae bacterium]